MKIQNSQPLRPIAFNGIKINRADNKHVQYLNNKIMDMITIDRLTGKGGCGAVFTNDFITLATEKQSILDKLKELGVKWIMESK